VVIPDDPGYRVDWEAELAIVIGRRGHQLTTGQALDHVAGYTIMNDISARGRHARREPLAPPFAYDWLGAKGLDTFSPMGPGLTPTWSVPDPQDLRIRFWLNGELKQDGTTSEMIFPVAELVAAASRVMTLEPGDVIATGTPAGVGVARGESVVAGNQLTVEIPPLGRITNPVRLAASHPAHAGSR
jgi:2,4-diketo-3-deoxy-L-fuconate hydrolase